ncbi:hypothetical protein BaRGS_00028616, partial [Batillaria attramentaria]
VEDSKKGFLHALEERGQVDILEKFRTELDEHNYGKNLWQGDLETVKAFIEDDGDVNTQDEEGSTLLKHASEQGQPELVNYLISQGALVNTADNEGCTPLHSASAKGHTAVVEVLLVNKASIDAVGFDGTSPLFLACQNEHTETMKTLLQHGANVDMRGNQTMTPLMAASIKGNKEAVTELLKRGAEVTAATSGSSMTALHYACIFGHEDVAALLLKNNAPIDARDLKGCTPLLCASQFGRAGIVEMLTASGADVNTEDGDKITPLHAACSWSFRDKKVDIKEITLRPSVNARSCKNTSYQCLIHRREFKPLVTCLLRHHAKVNAQDVNGRTPVHDACGGNDRELLKLLIGSGADISIKQNDGGTPLHLACREGHTGVSELLIQHGVDINVKDSDGWTPLHLACWEGHSGVTELLIRSGADIKAKKTGGWTPLHLACCNGHTILSELLAQNGADINVKKNGRWTPLHLACINGHTGVCERLIRHGADLNVKDNVKGWTPLHLACWQGHTGISELLIQKGADISAKKAGGWTPLHLACSTGHTEVIQLLIQNGAGINVKTNDGRTPLHLACCYGHREVSELLIQQGADINVTNKGGFAPLHLACSNGHRGVSDLLMKNGADVNTPTDDGSTALHLVSLAGQAGACEFLISRGALVDFQNHRGLTPLHLASMEGHAQVIELLIQLGADVDAQRMVASDNEIRTYSYGQTPLHEACVHGQENSCELLLKRGAKINVQDHLGNTPLHLAIKYDRSEIVDCLLHHNADVDVKNNKGLTPLTLANKMSSRSMVIVLLKRGKFSRGPDSTKSEDFSDHEDGKSDCKPLFNPKWQVSGQFDTYGGQLQTNDSDVVLYIPDGALPVGVNSVTFQGAVSTDLTVVHKELCLSEKETISSPVTEYYANDTHFHKPVRIVLPHFLPPDYCSERVSVYQFHQDRSGCLKVERLSPQEPEDQKEATYIIVPELQQVHIFAYHFTGYVCAYCKAEIEPPFLQLRLYGKHIQRARRHVDLFLFVWDSRLDIRDFRKAGLPDPNEEKYYITSKNLRGIHDITNLDLGVRLTVDEETWMHREFGGKVHLPAERRLDLLTFVPCCLNTIPSLVDWTLHNRPGQTPDRWFDCAIEVGYVKQGEKPLRFLDVPQQESLSVSGLELQNEQKSSIAQTEESMVSSTHVKMLAASSPSSGHSEISRGAEGNVASSGANSTGDTMRTFTLPPPSASAPAQSWAGTSNPTFPGDSTQMTEAFRDSQHSPLERPYNHFQGSGTRDGRDSLNANLGFSLPTSETSGDRQRISPGNRAPQQGSINPPDFNGRSLDQMNDLSISDITREQLSLPAMQNLPERAATVTQGQRAMAEGSFESSKYNVREGQAQGPSAAQWAAVSSSCNVLHYHHYHYNIGKVHGRNMNFGSTISQLQQAPERGQASYEAVTFPPAAEEHGVEALEPLPALTEGPRSLCNQPVSCPSDEAQAEDLWCPPDVSYS